MWPTYEIIERDGQTAILCLICTQTSFHPEDVRQRYCGSCHQFHDIMQAAIALDPQWRPDDG